MEWFIVPVERGGGDKRRRRRDKLLRQSHASAKRPFNLRAKLALAATRIELAARCSLEQIQILSRPVSASLGFSLSLPTRLADNSKRTGGAKAAIARLSHGLLARAARDSLRLQASVTNWRQSNRCARKPKLKCLRRSRPSGSSSRAQDVAANDARRRRARPFQNGAATHKHTPSAK